MHFDSPWAFLLLLLLPPLLALRARQRARGAIRFPSVGHVARSGRSLRQRLAGLPLGLRAAGLALLVVALARPQRGLERVKDVNQGIAIMMALDRSGSMGAELEYRGERMSRLDAAKRVFQEFVLGNDRDLPGRSSDLVGMVAFARYPDTVCPLTLAHGVLPPFLDSVRLVTRRNEDGTAIGDALALAAARLKTAEETLKRQNRDIGSDYQIKSKAIILLTDGQNNCGRRTPAQAAELAARWGIKVYAIGIGGDDAVTTVQTPFGSFKMPSGPGIDDEPLRQVARATGGQYWRAESAKGLHAIYREIDKLERTRIESIRYVDYREEFWPWALAALGLLGLEIVLANTLLRRIP